jgi:hypothetical protein
MLSFLSEVMHILPSLEQGNVTAAEQILPLVFEEKPHDVEIAPGHAGPNFACNGGAEPPRTSRGRFHAAAGEAKRLRAPGRNTEVCFRRSVRC